MSLRTSNHSPATVAKCLEFVRQLIAFLAERGMPTSAGAVRREHVEAYLADEGRRRGWKPSTSRTAFASTWPKRGEVAETPLARMRPPKLPRSRCPSSPTTNSPASSCTGIEERRDQAILRLFVDTGMRLSELTLRAVTDLDLHHQVAQVLGKGRRPRACVFGDMTAFALRRYPRKRDRHPRRASELWVGPKGPLIPNGVRQMVRPRAVEAGLGNIHPTSCATPSPTAGWPTAARVKTSCA